jgi:hypothetical protein
MSSVLCYFFYTFLERGKSMQETIVERVKRLCHEKGVSVAQMQRDLGFKKGGVYKWNEYRPSIPAVQKMSVYFGKSMSYILDGVEEDVPAEAAAENFDVRKELENIIFLLNNNSSIVYSGNEVSGLSKQVLIDSIQHTIKIADMCQSA